ncbi:MAG: ECF-type sigma factor [Planctomycetota bacterium]|jgi:RNA polymerase sigma factor (TIGR02999 family)
MDRPTDGTRLLHSAREGDRDADRRLIDLLHGELQRLAGSMMTSERGDHTLQPTALVNEACLRLFQQQGAWEGREHYLAVAATIMRRILTDHARGRRSAKRGGGWERVTLGFVGAHDGGIGGGTDAVDLLELDEALTELAGLAPRQTRIVEMRFLAGMTVEQVAAALALSRSTIESEWRMARAWLRRRLGSGPAG